MAIASLHDLYLLLSCNFKYCIAIEKIYRDVFCTRRPIILCKMPLTIFLQNGWKFPT